MRGAIVLAFASLLLAGHSLPVQAEAEKVVGASAREDDLLEKNTWILIGEAKSLYFKNAFIAARKKIDEALALANRGLKANPNSFYCRENKSLCLIYLAYIDEKQ